MRDRRFGKRGCDHRCRCRNRLSDYDYDNDNDNDNDDRSPACQSGDHESKVRGIARLRLRRLQMLHNQLRGAQTTIIVDVQPVGQVHAFTDLAAPFGQIEADGL